LFFFSSAQGFVIIWVRFAFSRLVYSECLTVLIYLSMKEDSLLCFVFMRFIESGCFRSCSLCLSTALAEEGAWAWFQDDWTSGAKVLQYWIISSLKIKLNRSWKFWRNWNVCFMLLERSWWARFNGIYLVRFGLRMWEILSFKVISAVWKFK
jgi:hypothetical protein